MNRRTFLSSMALSAAALVVGCKSKDPEPAAGGDAAAAACACGPDGKSCACEKCMAGDTANCLCKAK